MTTTRVRLDRLPLLACDPDEAGAAHEAENLIRFVRMWPRVRPRVEVDGEVIEL